MKSTEECIVCRFLTKGRCPKCLRDVDVNMHITKRPKSSLLSRLRYGFIFSIPATVIIFGLPSMSEGMNNEVGIGIMILALAVALPWSAAAGVLYLMSWSMHGSTELAVQYVALATFFFGAHFNAVLLFSPKSPASGE